VLSDETVSVSTVFSLVRFKSGRLVVNAWSTNRRALSWVTFAFLLLVLSIFTWGLEYKLSLYDPPQSTSHQMAQAKLLSKDQDEQAAVANSLLRSPPKASPQARNAFISSVFVLSFMVLLSLGALSEPHEGRDSDRPWHVCSGASLNAFFFRPPPIFG